jgi:hypothetical protein
MDPSHEDMINARYTMDGASTLSEAARMLKDYADELIKMEKDGWQLTDEVNDDWGNLYREKPVKNPRWKSVRVS